MSDNTSYCSGNATENDHQFTVTSGLYIALGVIGNLAAIVVLVKQSKFHNWKVFYRLALSLVSVDLLGVLMFGSISVKENSTSKWDGGYNLCVAESIIIIFISLTNLLTVAVISLERFLALWHPYFYSSLKNHPIIKLIPVVILSMAVVMAILPAISIGHFERIYPCDFCFINIYDSELRNFIYALLYSIFGLICITIAIVFNVLVVTALSRGQRGYSRQRESRIYISYDRRDYFGMMFQLLALIAELAVCWGSVMVRDIDRRIFRELLRVIQLLQTAFSYPNYYTTT